MPRLSSALFLLFLVVSAESTLGSRLQQNETQKPSPAQQAQPMPQQRQVISRSFLRTLAGCVIQSDHGYFLKTDSEAYPIDSDEDLANFVDMQVKVTGALEHHTPAAPLVAGANLATVTNLHILKLRSVIGTCTKLSNDSASDVSVHSR